jgi:hypothetical protein
MGKTASLANIGSIADSSLGFRNRLINGAQIIDQRNNGSAVTMSNPGTFDTDRWYCINASDGVMTAQQVSDAPTGFINSLKCTTTTADATLGTSQRALIAQSIEGFNIADLAWGTASAATVTISFWTKSSLTGTFGGSLRNSSADRSYPFTYTINSANTWEQKSVTIAGDTSGTWLTTSGIGIGVHFGLGVATNLSGTAGAWAAANNLSATGAVSVLGTLSATWQITGVQLEKGSTATSFDYRSYGQELALCQRYYYAFAPASLDFQFPICRPSTTASDITIAIPCSMRGTPSIVGSPNYARIVGYDTSFGLATVSCTAAVVGASANLSQINVTFTNGSMAGTYVHCSLDTVSNNGFNLSAEL